jgi:hypothetical protein
MKSNLRLATILAVTFFGAISAQAEDYSAAGANAYVQSRDYQGLLKYATAWSKAEPNNADALSYLGPHGTSVLLPFSVLTRHIIRRSPFGDSAYQSLGPKCCALQTRKQLIDGTGR